MGEPSRRNDVLFIVVLLLVVMVVWGIIFALGFDNGDIAGLIAAFVVGMIWVLVPRFNKQGKEADDEENEG